MYLAYVDDSGTGDKKDPIQLVSAIIIEDKNFTTLEMLLGAAIEAIVPKDRLEEFEEFHAIELYGGYGVFKDVEQTDRFSVIQVLLNALRTYKVPIVYGAVHKEKMADKLYGSADPLDICFRICVEGIEEWAGQFMSHELALLIVDDCSDGNLKKTIRASFRRLRKRVRAPEFLANTSWHLHDDMYFGNSKDSIGIQLADLCGYFIRKHLRGGDEAAEGFFKVIEDRIFHSQIEPGS